MKNRKETKKYFNYGWQWMEMDWGKCEYIYGSYRNRSFPDELDGELAEVLWLIWRCSGSHLWQDYWMCSNLDKLIMIRLCHHQFEAITEGLRKTHLKYVDVENAFKKENVWMLKIAFTVRGTLSERFLVREGWEQVIYASGGRSLTFQRSLVKKTGLCRTMIWTARLLKIYRAIPKNGIRCMRFDMFCI